MNKHIGIGGFSIKGDTPPSKSTRVSTKPSAAKNHQWFKTFFCRAFIGPQTSMCQAGFSFQLLIGRICMVPLRWSLTHKNRGIWGFEPQVCFPQTTTKFPQQRQNWEEMSGLDSASLDYDAKAGPKGLRDFWSLLQGEANHWKGVLMFLGDWSEWS